MAFRTSIFLDVAKRRPGPVQISGFGHQDSHAATIAVVIRDHAGVAREFEVDFTFMGETHDGRRWWPKIIEAMETFSRGVHEAVAKVRRERCDWCGAAALNPYNGLCEECFSNAGDMRHPMPPDEDHTPVTVDEKGEVMP